MRSKHLKHSKKTKKGSRFKWIGMRSKDDKETNKKTCALCSCLLSTDVRTDKLSVLHFSALQVVMVRMMDANACSNK